MGHAEGTFGGRQTRKSTRGLNQRRFNAKIEIGRLELRTKSGHGRE